MVRWSLFALALALGCGPAEGHLIGDDDLKSDTDTDTDGHTDTDTDTDTDGHTDTDTDTDGHTDTDTGPDYPLHWTGTREIIFSSGCSGDLDEDGVERTEHPDWIGAVEACDCDHVFRVEVSPDSICDASVQTVVGRGVRWLSSTTFRLYNLRIVSGSWQASSLADGTVSGDTISYSYTGSLGGGTTFSVDGVAVLD